MPTLPKPVGFKWTLSLFEAFLPGKKLRSLNMVVKDEAAQHYPVIQPPGKEPAMRVVSSKRLMLVSLALLTGFAGCASAGGTSARGGRPNRFTAEDLVEVRSVDLFTAIQQLRPRWLATRGRGSVQIIVDNTPRRGGIEELRAFRVTDVEVLELLSASDATTRFGTGYEAGAIMVRTRRR